MALLRVISSPARSFNASDRLLMIWRVSLPDLGATNMATAAPVQIPTDSPTTNLVLLDIRPSSFGLISDIYWSGLIRAYWILGPNASSSWRRRLRLASTRRSRASSPAKVPKAMARLVPRLPLPPEPAPPAPPPPLVIGGSGVAGAGVGVGVGVGPSGWEVGVGVGPSDWGVGVGVGSTTGVTGVGVGSTTGGTGYPLH